MANYISLYSGSSGNCSIVEQDGKFIIIDIGKSAKITNAAIKEIGLELKNLQAVFISHEHQDHVQGLKVFLKNLAVPVYSNAYTLDFLIKNNLLPEHTQTIDLDYQGVTVGEFRVCGFEIPHDSQACTGFKIFTNTGTSMALATDLGCVSKDTYENLKGNDLVVLEANYDEYMLKTGPYPYYLKSRIASNRGHLSNEQAGMAAYTLLKDGVKKIRFCHLSNTNNTPNAVLAKLALICQGSSFLEDDSIHISVNRRHDITQAISF